MHEDDFYAHNLKFLLAKANYLDSTKFLKQKVNLLTVQCLCVLFAMAAEC